MTNIINNIKYIGAYLILGYMQFVVLKHSLPASFAISLSDNVTHLISYYFSDPTPTPDINIDIDISESETKLSEELLEEELKILLEKEGKTEEQVTQEIKEMLAKEDWEKEKRRLTGCMIVSLFLLFIIKAKTNYPNI